MSHPIFHLQVLGGLVSRLRAVLGAMAYCEESGRRLVIDWPRSEPSETLGTFPIRFSEMWEHPYEETDIGRSFRKRDIEFAEFRTCHIEDFHPYVLSRVPEYFDRLTPTAELQTLIDAVKLPHPIVGLQIRRAMKAPATVGLDWFQDRTAEICRADRCNAIFLAADEKGVSTRMQTFARARLLEFSEQAKDYAYDRTGIVKAAADLYLLRQCDWVVGSNRSSYSELVALLRGAEYKGSHTKHDGLAGGRYEDAWNEAGPEDLAKALPLEGAL